ncbi:MAG: hypothetical protein ABID38_04740 [Candidatus Diapherotrites archaeon]
MGKFVFILIIFALLLIGCSSPPETQEEYTPTGGYVCPDGSPVTSLSNCAKENSEPEESVFEPNGEPVVRPEQEVIDCGQDFNCFKIAIPDCDLAKTTQSAGLLGTYNAEIQEDCSILIKMETTSGVTTKSCKINDQIVLDYFDSISEMNQICDGSLQIVNSKLLDQDDRKVMGGNSIVLGSSELRWQIVKIVEYGATKKDEEAEMDSIFWEMEPKEGWKREYFWIVIRNDSLKKESFSSSNLRDLYAFSNSDEIEFDIHIMPGEKNISSIPAGDGAIYYGAALLPEDRTTAEIIYRPSFNRADAIFLFE